MNKNQAEDFVYKSYLKAQKHQRYEDKDSGKRRNDLTYNLLRKVSKTPCCVITGSKGKGSVANMISQILQTKYTVGLMTSPHIVDFCERFQVNGGKIADQEFVRQIEKIRDEINTIDEKLPENVCISPMGIQAFLALNYFKDQKTDFNIFECGKGARYDDVNNIKHEYAVINSIFLEHTRELGDSLEEIAEDKAHVITGEQKCIYVAEQTPTVIEVIKKRAKQFRVPMKVYGKDFFAENIQYTKEGMLFDVVIEEKRYEDIVLPLLGEHQAKNCALAMALCKDIFCDHKLLTDIGTDDAEHISVNHFFSEIKKKLQQICWPGRMEVINKDPFILLDACINNASCLNVIKVLNHLEIKKATVIIGIPDDKDYVGVAKAMQEMAEDIILTKSGNPHYIFTEIQKDRLIKEGIHTQWTNSVKEALELAMEKNHPIVILGTTSVIAEVKNITWNR